MAGSDSAPDDGGEEVSGGDSSQVRRALKEGEAPSPTQAPNVSSLARPTVGPPSRARAMPQPRPPKNLADAKVPDAAPEPDPDPPESGELRRSSMELDLDGLRPSVPPNSLPPPLAQIGRYPILGRLASGGMADIFLGQQEISAGAVRPLVVKVLRQHLVADSEFEAMFLREGRVAMQLSHPNICTVYEFGKWGGHYFIAMEYIDGVTLKELLHAISAQGELLPVPMAVAIIAHMASALEYAHTARDSRRRKLEVVHRDVSPQNIMIRYDGVLKLLDFGVAKVGLAEEETKSDAVKGKFAYIAPEQCVAGDVDSRTDIFSLGICLFEALSGRRLYRRESQYETFHAIVSEPAPSLRELDDSIPPELDAIVQKALAKEKDARFQTAGEMQQALEMWLTEQGELVNAQVLRELMSRIFAEAIESGPTLDRSETVVQRLHPISEHLLVSSLPPPPEADAAGQSADVDVQSGPVPTAQLVSPAVPAPIDDSMAMSAASQVEPAQARSKLPWLILAAVALISLAIGGTLAVQSMGEDPAPEAVSGAPAASPAQAPATTTDQATAVAMTPAPALEPEPEPAAAQTEAVEVAPGEDSPPEAAESEAAEMRSRRRRRRRRGARRRTGFVQNPGF